MTKTKVVDLEKLYNFVVHIFSFEFVQGQEYLFQNRIKIKHTKGGVDRGDKHEPLRPRITHFFAWKNAWLVTAWWRLVTICRGGLKYSRIYKPMISGGGRAEAFQPPLQIQYVVVVSIMLGRWLWHFLLGAGIICITIGFIPRPAYPVRVILQGRLPKIWLWWFIYNWHIWSRNVFSRDIGGDLVY